MTSNRTYRFTPADKMALQVAYAGTLPVRVNVRAFLGGAGASVVVSHTSFDRTLFPGGPLDPSPVGIFYMIPDGAQDAFQLAPGQSLYAMGGIFKAASISCAVSVYPIEDHQNLEAFLV